MDYIKTIENLKLKIWNPSLRKETNFVLSDGQQEILKSIEENCFTLVKQTRQVGITSCLISFLLAYALNNPNSSLIYVTESIDGCKHAAEVLNYLAGSSLVHNNFKKIKFSDNSVVFQNGAKIKFIANSEFYNNTKGLTYNVIVFDLAAFFHKRHILDIQQCLADNGKVIISSCPRYKNGEFYELWNTISNYGKLDIPHRVSVDSYKTYWQGSDYPNKMRQFFEKENSFKMEMLGEFVDIPQE